MKVPRAIATGPANAPDLEFQALVRSKYAGNPRAMTSLGARLIVGRKAPFSPVDGELLIEEAAKQGDPEAWSRIAVLAAAGVGRPRSWPDAFDALGRAADLGDPQAARQLQLLQECGVRGVADVQDWITSATPRTRREAPHLAACADLLTPALCSHLMDRTAPKLVRAQVYDAYHGGLKTDPMRTSTGVAYSLIDTDLVMQLIRARISHAAGAEVEMLEPTEVLHYAVGERYRPHFDFFHPALPNYAEEMRLRGQRVKTCLVYLNDGYDGGETSFPEIGVKFRGRTGEALIFTNVLADGSGDKRTLHTGQPPTRGEKWLLSQWIRDKQQPVA